MQGRGGVGQYIGRVMGIIPNGYRRLHVTHFWSQLYQWAGLGHQDSQTLIDLEKFILRREIIY